MKNNILFLKTRTHLYPTCKIWGHSINRAELWADSHTKLATRLFYTPFVFLFFMTFKSPFWSRYYGIIQRHPVVFKIRDINKCDIYETKWCPFPITRSLHIILILHNFYINSIAVFCGGTFKEPRDGYNTTFLQTIGVTVEDYENGSWVGNSSLTANEIFQKAVFSPIGWQ